MIVLDLGPRPDKDIQLRAKDCPVLPKGEGSFRAESATSCHPYRLGQTSRTANHVASVRQYQ